MYSSCIDHTMAAVVTEIVANACHLEMEKVTHIETLLSRFDSLSAAEQDQERASYVAAVFPLFFGAAAVVHGSNGYEPQRIVPWYVYTFGSTTKGMPLPTTTIRSGLPIAGFNLG